MDSYGNDIFKIPFHDYDGLPLKLPSENRYIVAYVGEPG